MDIHKKSRLTFGLILDWLASWDDTIYYQSKVFSGVNDFTSENDINFVCFVTGRLNSTHGWESMRNILFDLIKPGNIDGLIIPTGSIGLNKNDRKSLEFLDKFSDIPIVTINDVYKNYHGVSINNQTGMRQIIDHLIEVHGCREIAFVKGPVGNFEAQLRYEAYSESLAMHGIPLKPELIYQDKLDFNYTSGSEAVKEFLDERKIRFDAIACSNDNMAMGAMTELNSRTDRIMSHIPVTGFDDVEFAKHYSLTTVHQSFYELARVACGMLLKIICGKEVPLNESIPGEIIVRSSCGCVPDNIRGVAEINFDRAGNSPMAAFEKLKAEILSEFSELNSSLMLNDMIEFYDLAQKVANSLYLEVNSDEGHSFLHLWNRLIFWSASKKMDLLILEDLLTILRKNILPCFNDISYASRLESLIHAARIQVSEAVQRTTVSHSVTTYIQMEGVGILGENMASSFDFEKQMEVIAEELPRSGMKSGFICLYEDPGKPLDKARLVMAFNEDGKINLSRKKLVFPTTDLLPGSIMKDFRKNRFNVIVQALYHADSHLGYAIFDYGKQIIKYIETIRYRLSLTFKGALLIDKIRKQAENLEVQVATRTCELSEANMLLEEEIKRRKKVEEQLKKALGHLEVHNRKLHYQSLRDELTGLYNRRGFMTLGIQHYHYALNSNRKFLVIYADMDGLKQINDEFGHKEGDFAIARSAEILSKSFRNMDIVARLGGDEFTILMVDASMKDFVELKKRLQNSFETYNKRSGKPYRLSVSIGTTCFDPEAPFPFDELLIQADKALYEEKHHRINK